MTFRLARCPACGAFHHPPREICPTCRFIPDGAMPLKDAPNAGEVLAIATLHVSLDEAFRDRLPLPIATVRTDAGPVVLAVHDAGAVPGERVALSETDTTGPPTFRTRRAN